MEWVNDYDAAHETSTSLTLATVVGVEQTYTYTGEKIVPEFRVYLGGKLLVLGKDYDYQIDNNKAIGTATISIIGIGNYSGTKTVTFAIEGQKYKVTYVTEYGTAPATKEVSVLTESDLPTLTDDDYEMKGWYNGDTKVTAGTTLTADTTLTAKWEEKTFVVTFVTEHSDVPSISGQKMAALPNPLPTPANADSNYYFAGWYIGDTKATAGQTISAATTLTAKWISKTFWGIVNTDEEGKVIHTLEAEETAEAVVLKYSTDNGSTWNTMPETGIELTSKTTIIGAIEYEGTVITETPSITFDDNRDEDSISFDDSVTSVTLNGTEDEDKVITDVSDLTDAVIVAKSATSTATIKVNPTGE